MSHSQRVIVKQDEINLETLVKYVDDTEDANFTSRANSEECRDFYDGEQLPPETKAGLKERGQPEVVFNMVQPKVDFLRGQERKTRTTVKAFPRTPMHDGGADAATDSIRFVADNNDFESITSETHERMVVEGTGGCAVEAEVRGGKIEITIKDLRWDRLGIDPHSMRRDALDAKYIYYVSWKDLSEAQARWPDADFTESSGIHVLEGETLDDKPQRWWSSNRQRVMCVDICFLHKGTWFSSIFSQGSFLENPEPSTFVDTDGIPLCKFIIASAYVDRDGQRYGLVKQYIDPQKEVNARRSKSLHLLNVRQTFGRKGFIKNLNIFKKEINKPDGHWEYEGAGQFGKEFGIMPTEGLIAPQFNMYLDAQNFLNTSGANEAQRGTLQGDQSGRAIQTLQQGGAVENSPLLDTLSNWKRRVYRQVWFMIKQYWTEERWIRVTDDEENLQWVGLNAAKTVAEQMVMDNTGLKLSQVRQQFGAELQQIHQQRPELAQQTVENPIAEIDVDIIIDEVPDVINLQSEQLEQLIMLYQANPKTPQNPEGIPWEMIIEMTNLRNKKRVLGKDPTPEEIQNAQAQAERQQQFDQIEIAKATADIQGKTSKAELDSAEAEAQLIENAVVQSGFENLVIDRNLDTEGKQIDNIQKQVETFKLANEPIDSVNVVV